MAKSPLSIARAAKEHAKSVLSRLPGVVGIGLTKVEDRYAVKVNLEAELPRSAKAPRSIDGVPVKYDVVGRIRAR